MPFDARRTAPAWERHLQDFGSTGTQLLLFLELVEFIAQEMPVRNPTTLTNPRGFSAEKVQAMLHRLTKADEADCIRAAQATYAAHANSLLLFARDNATNHAFLNGVFARMDLTPEILQPSQAWLTRLLEAISSGKFTKGDFMDPSLQ